MGEGVSCCVGVDIELIFQISGLVFSPPYTLMSFAFNDLITTYFRLFRVELVLQKREINVTVDYIQVLVEIECP